MLGHDRPGVKIVGRGSWGVGRGEKGQDRPASPPPPVSTPHAPRPTTHAICPNVAGLTCPGAGCPGRSEAGAGACRHLATLSSWRGRTAEEQAFAFWSDAAPFAPRVEVPGGRVRVGLWCPCLGLGGAEAWQLALIRAVDPDSVAWVGAAVLEGRNAVAPRMLGELSERMPVGLGLDAARSLATASDVILSWAVADVGALLAGLDAPPRVAMACHFPGESPWGPGTEAMLGGVSRFVAVSELALDALPGPIRGEAEVIWNAVDADRLRPRRDRAAMRAAWGVPAEAPVAGYMGRLAPEKDPAAMIRLAGALPDAWHVVLVGEGRERASLIKAVAPRDAGRIHLVGGDVAAGDVLGGFDALVVPSRYESFGLTLAEGLWAGVPVVSTRSGLAKLVPGLVREVPVDAPGPDLARAILADRSDPVGTAARVARAKRFARDRLGLDRFGREWTEFLTRLAGPKNVRCSPCRKGTQGRKSASPRSPGEGARNPMGVPVRFPGATTHDSRSPGLPDLPAIGRPTLPGAR